VVVDHVARLSGAEIALARVLPALGEYVHVHVILGEDGPLVAQLRDSGIEVEVLALSAAAGDTRKETVTATGVPLSAARATA
jgi:hypothetical protein